MVEEQDRSKRLEAALAFIQKRAALYLDQHEDTLEDGWQFAAGLRAYIQDILAGNEPKDFPNWGELAWDDKGDLPGLEARMYAGLDTDGIAKLFYLDSSGKPQNISHPDWLLVLDHLKARPGELLVADLFRETDQ